MFRLFLLFSLATIPFAFAQFDTIPAHSDTEITIAVGSCNKQKLDQPFWNVMANEKPDVFVWGGDIIYADTQRMDVLEGQYELQNNRPDYKKFKEKIPVVGTWDDHDYGDNDSGAEFPEKKKSQQLFLDFLDVPRDSPRRTQKGIYFSHVVSSEGGSVKILVLDTRYFRSPLVDSKAKNKRYQPTTDTTTTILGAKQWQWLDNELHNSSEEFVLIVSSIQVLSDEHGFETWGNFPHEQRRLEKMIQRSPATVLIVSGDRHISEVSQKAIPGITDPLIDFTSSGLTHAYDKYTGEPNSHRVSETIFEPSFGLIRFNLKRNEVIFEIRNVEKVLESYSVSYGD